MSALISKGGHITRLSKKFFWILLAGVVTVFGLLTFLIIQREQAIILDLFKEKSRRYANLIAEDIVLMMTAYNTEAVSLNIAAFNRDQPVRVGVAGPSGRPAFKTDIPIPPEIFSARKEQVVISGDEFMLYKPLPNDGRCHRCHDQNEKSRGMIVIKSSMADAKKAVNETQKRIIFFGLILGIISEVFLVAVLKKTILQPVDLLNRGAAALREGKLGHRIEITTNDEIGSLGEAFNHMASALEKSHEDLERAVRQKTNELRVIAELSSEVFRGNLTLDDKIGRVLDAIRGRMGYAYVSLCFVDRDTGMLSNRYHAGAEGGLCSMEIHLGSDHPFAKVINDARPAVKKPSEVGAPETFSNIAIIPVISQNRRRCRDTNLCTIETCPAYDCADERCWLMEGTLCRSPHSLVGGHKILGCLHCEVFPVIGVLILGILDDFSASSVHSLQILASVIASAVENHRFIEGKKDDITSLVNLHNISIEKSSALSMPDLTKTIVESSTSFAGMNAAILWLMESGGLRMERVFSSDSASPWATVNSRAEWLIPAVLPVKGSFPGQAIIEQRAIETTRTEDITDLGPFINHYHLRYAVAVPLKFKGTVSGCLTLFKRTDFLMTDSEKAIILLFASQSAAALNNSKLYSSLKSEKEFSDAIFNSASSGIIVAAPDGTIIMINNAGTDILQASRGELVGKKITSVIGGSEPVLSGKKRLTIELTVKLPGGLSIPIGFNTSRLTGSEDGENVMILLFEDLSEIKKLQSEVKKREYFETMGKIIAGVAHEVRNPLFGISSIGQLLERELEVPQHQTLIRAMLKETGRMQRLIEELLLYTRPSKLVISGIDMDILAMELKRYAAAKAPLISFTINMEGAALWADRDKITQVFMNLINNALDAAKSCVDVSAKTTGNVTEIRITDDGPGIPPENIERIFEPFFTTKQGGTGLGLPISRKIVEDHEGSIGMQSAEGGGTTVLMTFKA